MYNVFLYVAFELFGFLRVKPLSESKNVGVSVASTDNECSRSDSVSAGSNHRSGKSRKRQLSSEHPEGLKYFKLSSVNAEFLDVKKQLEDMLQACDAQKMYKECKSFMASEAHNIPLFANEKYLQSINECKLAPEVLQKLSPFVTWSDHSILTTVVKACNNPEADTLLQQFDLQLDLSLPITEYPVPQPIPSMAPYDSSTQTVLGVKLNVELSKVSLQQVLELRCLVQKNFQITEHSSQLMAAKSSSTILYWMIPKSVSHLISSKIMQDPSLHGSRVVELSIHPGTLFVTANTLKLGSLSFLNQINEMVSKFVYISCKYMFSFMNSFPGMKTRYCLCN